MNGKIMKNLTLRAERKTEIPSQRGDLWNDITNPNLANITIKEL
jgi:hypothetical protein